MKERAKIRIYGEKNKEKFKEELAQTNWNAVLLSTDPDTALDEFYEKINSVIWIFVFMVVLSPSFKIFLTSDRQNNIVENNKHFFVIHLYSYCDTIVLNL